MPQIYFEECVGVYPGTETLSDESLMLLIKTRQMGWRKSVSVLLERHHRALVNRCYQYLRNRADAEDAAQETELRAYRAIGHFRAEASFRTWLYAIADRQCHDLSRKRAKHMMDDQLRALIQIHEESTTGAGLSNGNQELVKQIMSRLTKPERDVLVLRFYGELSMSDIATQLGLKLSATKMRFYRALEHFAALSRIEQRDKLEFTWQTDKKL